MQTETDISAKWVSVSEIESIVETVIKSTNNNLWAFYCVTK